MNILLITPENDGACQNIRGISSYLKENGHKTIILNLPLKEKNQNILNKGILIFINKYKRDILIEGGYIFYILNKFGLYNLLNRFSY